MQSILAPQISASRHDECVTVGQIFDAEVTGSGSIERANQQATQIVVQQPVNYFWSEAWESIAYFASNLRPGECQ